MYYTYKSQRNSFASPSLHKIEKEIHTLQTNKKEKKKQPEFRVFFHDASERYKIHRFSTLYRNYKSKNKTENKKYTVVFSPPGILINHCSKLHLQGKFDKRINDNL